jgi:hypothetical protein
LNSRKTKISKATPLQVLQTMQYARVWLSMTGQSLEEVAQLTIADFDLN